jgi:anthranilate phosphoribosyltransferase
VFQFLSKEIEGGKNKDLADMFINIISGKGTEAQNNVVCANAGMAINNKCTLEGFQKERKFIIRKGLYLEQNERFKYLSTKIKINFYSDWNFFQSLNNSIFK